MSWSISLSCGVEARSAVAVMAGVAEGILVGRGREAEMAIVVVVVIYMGGG